MIEFKDDQSRRKFNLIEKADGRIKNIKFAELLSLLNQEKLDEN